MSKQFESRDELLEKIKQQAITDSNLQSQKKRFGLFSFKTPVAVCDTLPEKPLHPRDENGKVISKQKNVTTTIVKSGKVKSAYFSVPNYISIGDKYNDPGKLEKQQLMMQSKRLTKDQPPFKPQNSYQNIMGNAPYKNETHFIEEKKLARVNSENKVIIGPYNIVTGPYRSHIKYPHLVDEYSRLHERQKKALEEHKLRMKDKPSFRTWDSGNKLFTSNRQTYDILAIQQKKIKPRAQSARGFAKHEQPFKPSNPGKFGYNRTINKFPNYIENPIFKQRRRSADVKSKEPFKLNHALVLTGPTPSITLNHANLRKSIRPATAISFQH